MNKAILIVALVLIVLVGWIFVNPSHAPDVEESMEKDESVQAVETETDAVERSEITTGNYEVNTDASVVSWAGKKPLVDGYINSGTLNLSEGEVVVEENGSATGSFVIDMNTLEVGLTAKKPDQETALEGHLKGSRWFDVETHPTATFEIQEVNKVDGEDENSYVIVGELTMKGVTETVEFPAVIYEDAEGMLIAEASTEIDRTKWGITSGSGSFFDNLADNVIDDMVALSFYLEAAKK